MRREIGPGIWGDVVGTWSQPLGWEAVVWRGRKTPKATAVRRLRVDEGSYHNCAMALHMLRWKLGHLRGSRREQALREAGLGDT